VCQRVVRRVVQRRSHVRGMRHRSVAHVMLASPRLGCVACGTTVLPSCHSDDAPRVSLS
jgi:hypothetical protein